MVQQTDDAFLRIGYWFAVHRDQLRTWWAMSIIVVDFLLIAFFVVTFTGYSLSTVRTVQGVGEMAQTLVPSSLRAVLEPLPLIAGEAVALPAGGGHDDFVAPVENPNASWVAVEVRYSFTLGSTTTREERTVLWPKASAYLTQLNVLVPETSAVGTTKVTLASVQWERVPEPGLFSHDVKFPVGAKALKNVTGLTTGGTATRFSAVVKNESVYSFRSVRFGIILRGGGRILAAGEATVERFSTFTERPIEATWLQSLPLNAEVDVYPVVNLLDDRSYL